jgi:hypothetical protein
MGVAGIMHKRIHPTHLYLIPVLHTQCVLYSIVCIPIISCMVYFKICKVDIERPIRNILNVCLLEKMYRKY